jgi:hypothetical protein
MNLIEAVKSGKPFRRKAWANATFFFNPKDQTMQDEEMFSVSDILANDFEIEEKTITISESEFEKRIAKVKKEIFSGEPIIDTIKKALFGE